ncbi:pentatricopeptide repeat-containing protein At4g20770-like [Arachis ipaensis]|uniref:pentatricopeptide repeat-containing protein At4g20770-like n=1 Tax=Arachis ipaensis TaxID=130454 RepID=UPI000A2B5270|nr:pentatricopeptide repeat-containing protein At4g20770-like [Arachis ipaensis]XP_029148736.1 pentatricopeptide repeat-containing protein At4g20770-like [Arachis hypogaea]
MHLSYESNILKTLSHQNGISCLRDLKCGCGRKNHGVVIKLGLDGLIYVVNVLLSMYVGATFSGDVIRVFDDIDEPNEHPDRTTLAVILSSYAELGLLETRKQVHEASQKFRFDKDEYVSSGLVNMYSKCGKMESSKNIFSKLSEVDVCWNSMIAGFSINYLDKTKLSLSSSRCANAASILQSFPLLPFTLIEMYCKCGNVDQARYFFDMMPGKNTVTWNEMIHSYAENGYRDEAVSHYKDMITSGEKSDDITFVAVLTGCSHSALIDEGV